MMRQSELTPELAYDVVDALDSVFDDDIELRETARLLREETANPFEEAVLDNMLAEDQKNLDSRWDYAINAVAGRTFDEKILIEALADHVAEKKRCGVEPDLGRLTVIHSSIVEATYSSLRPVVEPGQTRPYGLGLLSLERIREAEKASAKAEEEVFVILGGTRAVRIARSQPDEKRPGKAWISITDPRTVEVVSGAPERVVSEYPVVAVEESETDGSVGVSFVTGERRTDTISAELHAELTAKGISTDAGKGPGRHLTIIEKVEQPDGSFKLIMVSNGTTVKKVRVAAHDDAYRLSPDGSMIQVYIPSNRTSLDRLSTSGLDALVDGVDARSSRSRRGSAVEVAVRAAAGPRRNIIEKFRPVNTGDSRDPRVNPMPVLVRKSS